MDNVEDIVNGAQLPRFARKPVSIVGRVREVNPNGHFFEIQTTDDVLVKINLEDTFRVPLGSWIEATGIGNGREVDADNFIIFSNADFDAQSHNELCSLLYKVPNIWNTE